MAEALPRRCILKIAKNDLSHNGALLGELRFKIQEAWQCCKSTCNSSKLISRHVFPLWCWCLEKSIFYWFLNESLSILRLLHLILKHRCKISKIHQIFFWKNRKKTFVWFCVIKQQNTSAHQFLATERILRRLWSDFRFFEHSKYIYTTVDNVT